MDYIQINNVSVPYPNGFTMKKEANITAEMVTLTGKTIADVSGWKYSDACPIVLIHIFDFQSSGNP